MDGGKFRASSEGFAELFRSEGVQQMLTETATQLAKDANGRVAKSMHTKADIYHPLVSVHQHTAIARVVKAPHFNSVDGGNAILKGYL